MAVRIESQAEPIPGYRLLERIGSGGFGEVWKCEAPGGLHKAIKFVYGEVQTSEESDARAWQELKGLSRIKDVHHPYLLSLERVDVIEGQLVIVMELAQRTLWDRFKECRAQGLPGVPRDELLRYLGETAEALDLMNQEHNLQHLDIKPQNLFLVHNHVKVADFGLVKALEGRLASVTGGLTPVYAAPETFDGKISRFSDQYSLAIVYQELLTGRRPFQGTSVRQLVLQHLQGTPDLSPLPPHDRPIVARALAKDPDQRYPSCLDFIQALRQAGSTADTEALRTATTAAVAPAPPAVSPEARREDAGTACLKSPPAPALSPPGSPPPVPATPSSSPRAGSPPLQKSPLQEEGCTNLLRPGRPRASAASPAPSAAPAALQPPTSSTAVLTPALVIGLGGWSQRVLRQLRRELQERFGPDKTPSCLRFLYIDTDAEDLERACQGGEEALHPAETLLARLQRPSYYLRPQPVLLELESWLPSRLLYRIPRQPAAAGVRALGRLAFVSNYLALTRRLEAELRACCDPAVWRQTATRTGLDVLGQPRVWLVASLGGGSGSGMLLDLAYTLRHLLLRLEQQPDILGLLLVPTPPATPEGKGVLANTYAALVELHHFSSAQACFTACYPTGEVHQPPRPYSFSGPAFTRCLLLPAEALPDSAAATPVAALSWSLAQASHLLFTELCTPLGRIAEQRRQARKHVPTATDVAVTVQLSRTYRICSPRRTILERAARRLCQRLVQRWMSKDAQPLRTAVQDWLARQWAELRLSPELLIEDLKEACQTALPQAPEEYFQQTLAPLRALAESAEKNKGGAAQPVSEETLAATVGRALRQLEQFLGVPEEVPREHLTPPGEEPPESQLGHLLQTLATSRAEEIELKLAQAVVALIEEPAYRLAGAEEAVRQLSTAVDQALAHQEPLSAELRARAAAAYQQVLDWLEQRSWHTPPPQLSWLRGRSRKAPGMGSLAADLAEALFTFAKCRYHCLIMQRLAALYLGLRGQLSDQLLEIDFCRARLGELATFFATRPADSQLPLPPAAARYLLPVGCGDLQEAVQHLEDGLGPEDLQALDRRIQRLLQEQFQALVHVCLASTSVLPRLAPQMCQEAEAFLAQKLPPGDAAAYYLRQETDSASLNQDLAAAFAAARSGAAEGAGEEIALLAAPPGPAGERFRRLVEEVLSPQVPQIVTGSPEEIVFYRETPLRSFLDVPFLPAAAREAYQALRAADGVQPHTRSDIADW
jgi:serine/threonine protein kinase